MKTFDVQSIEIAAPKRRVFDFIADPANLPRWTNAFREADACSARMDTPKGTVTVDLETDSRPEAGTVDWTMRFPDGAVATAYSRVTPEGVDKSVFTFVLMAPPVPLEALEGALDEQRNILAQELVRLKSVLEGR